jgi:hypothetical protein
MAYRNVKWYKQFYGNYVGPELQDERRIMIVSNIKTVCKRVSPNVVKRVR